MIARDKKLHFLVGIAIAIVVGLALMWLPTRLNEAPAGFFGVLAAGVAGWLKEKWYDARRPDRHTVDMGDFRWTLKGGFVGWALLVAACNAGIIPPHL
jgi:hypothetical protein